MKIGLCANTSWYIYHFRRNLLSEIRRQGHEVFVIAPFDEYTSRIQALGVPCFHLPLHQTGRNPFSELLSLYKFWTLLSTRSPDFLLTFTVKCNIYAGLLRRVCGFRQIANVSGLGEGFDRQLLFTRFLCQLYRIALQKAHKVFFQNQEDLTLFLDRNILSLVRCARLPGSGVDLTEFVPSPVNANRQKRVFLMFGRIIPRKGYEVFLQAAERFKETSACPNGEFQILGIQDPSRKASRLLFQKVLEFHRKGVIRYLPATENVAPIIQQADVVVLPSMYHEGVPRSLLEALACGKPIITTDWKGCRDTVEHGKNGFLIGAHNDLPALEKYISFFLQADSAVVRKMGVASRRKAEQEFDERIVIGKYLSELGGNGHCDI